MSVTWSQRLARHYHLRIPPDLEAWLDDQAWQQAGGAEFCRPQPPEQWLDPPPGTIWAGFMLPDTLPVVSNRYGDWLCLRVAADGSVPEVIYWCHGGGDWIPYGRTLAEALLYDVASHMLYAPRPEMVWPERPSHELDRMAHWALGWLQHCPRTLPPFWQHPGAHDPLPALLASRVAEVVVRRDLLLRHLDSPLKRHSDPAVARELGTAWEPEFVSWLFDTARIPPQRKQELSDYFQIPAAELTRQQWDAAEAEALQVMRIRGDLGWPFDVAGWAAERRGDWQQAVPRYLAGLRTSLFADETVRFRTHWYADGYGKFAAARLAELKPHLPDPLHQDPYLNLFWANDARSLRGRVCQWWIGQAHAAERQGRFLETYRCYYNAGWDLGLLDQQAYAEIFDGLVRSAQAAGAAALAQVAALHRRFLP